MITRTHTALAAIVVLSLATQGCFTVNASLPGTVRGDVASSDYEKVGTLNIEKNHWFYVFGLLNAPAENFFADDIKKQVQAKGGDGVANLTYEAQTGCMDLVCTGCSSNIISPRTYKVTGDIVRMKKEAVPGKPVASAPVAPSTEKVAQAY